MLFRTSNVPRSAAHLARQEQSLKCTLPDDYRTFLLKMDGGQPHEDNNTFKYKSFFRKNFANELVIASLHPIDDVVKKTRSLSAVLPPGYLPIARLNNGKALLLCVAKQQHGYVYIWETDYIEDGAPPVTIIAASFSELVRNLRGLEEDLSEVEPCNMRYYRYHA